MPRRGIVRRYKCDGCGTLGDGTGGWLPDGWNRWIEIGVAGRCYCGECIRKLSNWREEVLADAIQSRPRDVIHDVPQEDLLVRYLDQKTFTSKGYLDEEGQA